MYGEGSYGEAAYGEAVGLPAIPVSGSIPIREAPDQVLVGAVIPVFSVASVADQNMLVFVVELDLGQIF